METTMQDPQEPVWQGFFGPMQAAIAGKVLTDADARAVAALPN
jgi:hypothetical protein